MAITIRSIKPKEKEIIDQVAELHKKSFVGFFLSQLHPGFLRQLYKSFVVHKKSDLLVAFDGNKPVGFLAYSSATTRIYWFMLWRYFLPFVWYSFLSFLKKPSIFFKMFSALRMPITHKRDHSYIKIFSIGVEDDYRVRGIGTELINELKRQTDFSKYNYITLETDANDNDTANNFYLTNGFTLSKDYFTFKGRHMNKYHYRQHENLVS